MKMRTCKKCGQTLPLDKFRLTKKGSWLHIVCKDCENQIQKIRAQTPEGRTRKKAYFFKTRYGLTLDQHSQLLDSQNNKCAICFKVLLKPFTDHDHATGKVRGLLCGPCNMYIGHIQESLEVLESAKKYLIKHKTNSNEQGHLILKP